MKSQVVQTIQFPVFSLQCMSEYVSVCVGVCVCECAGMWMCVGVCMSVFVGVCGCVRARVLLPFVSSGKSFQKIRIIDI